MNDEFFWNQAADNFASLQAYEAQKYLTSHRKRFLLTMPEAIAEKVKAYANELRAEYDKSIVEQTKKEARAKFKEQNSLADWTEKRSLELWSTR